MQGGERFQHVLDFLIDPVEGGTQRVRNGGGVFGFQGQKSGPSSQVRKRLFVPSPKSHEIVKDEANDGSDNVAVMATG